MTKNNKYILAFFSCLALSLAAIHTASALDVGSNEISNTIQLTSDSPIKIAARIINIFMMFLGIIAVSLIIFAGFKWMTSAGNEENIEAAKKILKNAVIGLLIILSSWGIVSFILGRLIGDTGNGGLGGGGSKNGVLAGGGALGSCTVQTVYPEPEQKEVPRNTSIIVTFKEDLKLDTVCVNAGGTACACDNSSACNRLNTNYFKIYEGAGLPGAASSTNAIVSHPVGDNKTLVITPVLPLGSPSNNIWYTAYISNDVEATSGCPNGDASCGMFDTCATDYYRWQFEVSNKLDLTPPKVTIGGFFPETDNLKDDVSVNSSLASAVGSFKVNGTPKAYVPAQIGAVTSQPANAQPATVSLEPNYNEAGQSDFSITSILGNKAQLYRGGDSLGVSDFNGNNVTFPGYFTLAIGGDGSHPVGYMWEVSISAAQRADTITIGADTYTFVNGAGSGYNIEINSNPSQQAINIASALGARTDVLASANSMMVNIESKVGGFGGNSINLETNNYSTFTVNAMHGGTDNSEVVIVKDRKDKPMNSTIQLNFSEAVNPMTVSGNAGDVYKTIQVINNKPTAKLNGIACTQDSDCKSYKCENSKCLGDYLDGKFEISNGYKTLEFRTNNECGMNGCGEKIYCLPPSSNLRVKLMTGNFNTCTNDNDCNAKAPYTKCGKANRYTVDMVCKTTDGKNYPTALITPMVGAMDTSFNSLDGNRDGDVQGPYGFYDENLSSDFRENSCGVQFNSILSTIINKRIAENKTIRALTGSGCSHCLCYPTQLSNCVSFMNTSFTKIGFSGNQFDYLGGMWTIDENEEEGTYGGCRVDVLRSPNCGSYSVPLFLSHSVLYNQDCPAALVYNNNLTNWESPGNRDNYSWAFWVNDKIDATPPKIRIVTPSSDGSSSNLSDPIVIEFDKLIMSSSLKSGSLKLNVGTTTIEHKLLNLRNTTNAPTGYWTSSENLDFSPLDGQPDITRAEINHSMFGENIDYVSQVGSGVKDIFQNCFKPSSGPDCTASQDTPSCCNGQPRSTLDSDGDCAIN